MKTMADSGINDWLIKWHLLID